MDMTNVEDIREVERIIAIAIESSTDVDFVRFHGFNYSNTIFHDGAYRTGWVVDIAFSLPEHADPTPVFNRFAELGLHVATGAHGDPAMTGHDEQARRRTLWRPLSYMLTDDFPVMAVMRKMKELDA